MRHPILGAPKMDAGVLEIIDARGGDWAAYQNVDLGSRELGHIKGLKVGPGCTFATPPDRLPDTPDVINWRYYWVGWVDKKTGKIVPEKPGVTP